MKASKVFVFPSNREGFGLIALEANAAGLPVLTLDHPNNAATDLIRHGKNGYLFKDEKALVRLLNRYFADDSNKGVSANLGEYSWNQTADLVQEVYAS
jgi:glycosyltransferase involved in cell wall biosynthesis